MKALLEDRDILGSHPYRAAPSPILLPTLGLRDALRPNGPLAQQTPLFTLN